MRLSVIILTFFCFLNFTPHSQSQQTNANQSAQIVVRFGEMAPKTFYYFSDHGSGMAIVKYDRTEGNNIYTFASISPQHQSYSGPGLWGTIYEAGNIRLATPQERGHLIRCMMAGAYVPQ
jgi:hypothetical protein